RFKDFMHSRITKGLSVIAAGADSPAEDEAAARLQRCHEVLLQTIEAGHQADERWGQVPPDAPALRAFHDQRHTLRTLAERGLTDPKVLVGPALDRGEAILGFLDEMVQLIQSREEHLADRDTAGSAAVVTAVAACLGGEEQSLRALIAHERLPITDERTWNRQGEDLRHERERRARLTGLAWEWFELVIGLPDLHQNLEQQLTDAPDAARAEAHAQWNALDTARAVIETALGKALQERSRVAAVQAKGDLSILRHGYDDLLEDIDQRLHQDQEESEWRKRAGEPGIAKALARLDAARTALNKARTAQRNLDEAAAKAQVGRELAEIAAEEAQEAAEHIRQDTDQMREELEQRRQQVRDALDNPEPKPEGDTKF
ncbi:MAG TPA: hypothetical protein VHX44_19275, partial [Planctomycetota bacterium]|nr:hypothetical protein [Planctomycetota bacterium]